MQFALFPELSLLRAFSRAQYSILSVALVYSASILVGIIMVNHENRFALEYRDKLVGTASRHDPAASANNQGRKIKAAMLDFTGNLIVGSVPKSLMGMAVILPFPFVAYQGWVGGIVSVRADHTSRLNNIHSAVYYLLTLVLQITGYSIAVGAGVNVGIALLRPSPHYQGEKWLRIFPKEALSDLGKLYLLAAPVFFVGSFWEFLSSWNV